MEALGCMYARPCSLMHCSPNEGRSCRVVGHRWLHTPGLPAITALPLLSPSPSSSFYTSALYFPPFFSAHVPLTCSRFFFPPNFFSLTPPPLLAFLTTFSYYSCARCALHQSEVNEFSGGADIRRREMNSWAYADKQKMCTLNAQQLSTDAHKVIPWAT